MPNPTALTIFKELKYSISVSDIAGILKLNHSTISTAVSSLIQEGLAQKQRDGKKVLVARANTLHARSLAEFLEEYTRLPVEEFFSYSSLEILGTLAYPHNITDIVAMTGLNRQTISSTIAKLSKYGIVIKEKRKFVLNKRHRQVSDFVVNYWRYITNQRMRDIAGDAIILWQRGPEILFKTHIDSEQDSESNIQPTATTVFPEYRLRTTTTMRYYFHSKRKLTVDDHIVHTILIDPQNPIYNSYAAALITQSDTKNLLTTGRLYDMEEHVKSLLEYLGTKEKNSNFVLPWNEYIDLLDSLMVD